MPRIKQEPLKRFYNEPICHTESICNKEILEIGVDEAGRGPLFGRVYTAAVILPKDDIFEYDKMKDSKKFTSHKKIIEDAKSKNYKKILIFEDDVLLSDDFSKKLEKIKNKLWLISIPVAIAALLSMSAIKDIEDAHVELDNGKRTAYYLRTSTDSLTYLAIAYTATGKEKFINDNMEVTICNMAHQFYSIKLNTKEIV